MDLLDALTAFNSNSVAAATQLYLTADQVDATNSSAGVLAHAAPGLAALAAAAATATATPSPLDLASLRATHLPALELGTASLAAANSDAASAQVQITASYQALTQMAGLGPSIVAVDAAIVPLSAATLGLAGNASSFAANASPVIASSASWSGAVAATMSVLQADELVHGQARVDAVHVATQALHSTRCCWRTYRTWLTLGLSRGARHSVDRRSCLGDGAAVTVRGWKPHC